MALLALVLLAIPFPVLAQTASEPPKTASIAGRVTVEGDPAAKVPVVLLSADPSADMERTIARTRTDEKGRFELAGLAAGRYVVSPAAPGYVLPMEGNYGRPGKLVTLREGEAVAGLDLALSRGGVVTGRVVDSDGRPVIYESVALVRVGDDGQKSPVTSTVPEIHFTDDRGAYRIYGVPPGRYLVSVGQDAAGESGMMRLGSGGWYAKTYHPAAAAEGQATLVTVTAGGEASGIDIVAAKRAKGFAVSGRVVEAGTGRPLAGLDVGYGMVTESSKGPYVSMYYSGDMTDEGGEFRFDGVTPGRYAVFAREDGEERSRYGDSVLVTVADADVAGLEVVLHPGATMGGVAVVEGTTDPAILEQLQQLRVSAATAPGEPGALSSPGLPTSRIAADGSFHVGGVRPGSVAVGLLSYSGPSKLSLLRVERDGVEVRGRIEVAPGEHVGDLRVVVGHGTGAIRGTVEVKGELPATARMTVSVRRAGLEGWGKYAEVDARRQFTIDGLPSGDYELTLSMYKTRSFPLPEPVTVTKPVTVASGSETAVTVTLDLEAPGGGRRE